jgi:hypothetical protein
MSKFKTGDIVIAITSKVCKINPREEGEAYKVRGVMKCPSCSDEYVCITDETFRPKTIKCAECGFDQVKSNHPWTSVIHFRLQGANLEEQIKDALAVENYELAAQLRDQLNK